MWGRGRRMERCRHREFLLIALQLFGSIRTSKLQDLTIDNRLVIVPNDCYTRVSIGTKLPDMDIKVAIKADSISDCQGECSKRRNSCVAFAFGIGLKGNTSCELSSKMPKPEDLQTNSDYDVYLRTERLPNCEPDRLYKIGKSDDKISRNKNNTRTNSRFSGGLFGSFLPNIYQPNRSENNGKGRNTSEQQQSYLSSFDDDQRILDIVRNKNYGLRPKIPVNEQKHPTFGTNNESKLTIDKSRPEASFNNFDEKIYLEKGHVDDVFRFDRPIVTKDDVYRPVTLIYRPTYDNVWGNKDLQNYDVDKPIKEIYSRPMTNDNIYEECTKKTSSNLSPYGDDKKRDFYKIDKSNGMIVENHQTDRTTTTIVVPSIENNYRLPVNWKPLSNGILKQFRPNQTLTFVVNSNDDAHLVVNNNNDRTNFINGHNKLFQVPVNVDNKSCYRRLLTGKKTVQVHVRRAVECQRLDECHRACDYEKYFVCEGFNYRRMGPGLRGMCEMTSVPYSRLNIHRDFQTDPQCDYYEKDPDCLRDTIPRQPSWPGPYPTGPGHTYVPDRRPSGDIPRPILDHDQRPIYQKTDPARPRPQVYGGVGVDGGPYETHVDPFFQQTHSTDGRPPIDNFSGNGYSYGRPLFPRPTYHGPIDRPYLPKYPDRRIDYGPYNDIGTNEIGAHSSSVDRRKDPRDWQVHGGIYGSSYGYDTNYVGHFDVPKYHPKSPTIDVKRTGPKQENDHFYGEFYNYGGAFGYGDNYIPADKDQLYGGTTRKEQRCTVRAGAGFKIVRGVIRRTYLTPNLEECESLCLNENNFLCMTLAYRYNIAATDPTDNCLLSEISYRDLNFYTDIEPNRDYDIYAIIGDPKTCDMMAQRHPQRNQNHRNNQQHPPDECFWRVRSGFGMPADVIRKSIFVDDLGECQVECTISREFTCRSFAFRYGLGGPTQRDPSSANCYLSDWPTQEINPTKMPDVDGAEIYERGSFGRGCEPYPFPPFKIGGQSKFPRGEDACYSGYHKPCRLTPYSVMLAINVNSESECRDRCSKMRRKDPTPCMSFSYKIRADRGDQNCLLSDVSIRDLRPGLDYAYDDDHVLYAWKDLEPQCMITGYSIEDNNVFGNQGYGNEKPFPPPPTVRPDSGPGSDQSDGIYIPDPRPFYGHDISRPFNSVYQHGLRPYDPDRPDPPVRPTNDPPYRPHGGHGDYEGDYGYTEHNNFHGSNGQDDTFPPSPDFATFQHYTVNGYPCKRDTKCERNDVAGFWSCETEGGEAGSWDYCCEPSHHCGYSQGFHYPWCYVGLSDDQWRPCSEKYYPYLPSTRPIQQDVYNNNNHPPHPPHHHHHGDYNGDDHGDRNDINYYSRHWPVTYLHREPPPNCTDSLASANDKRDNLFNGSSIVRSNNDNSRNGDRTAARFQSRGVGRRLVSRTTDIGNKNLYDEEEEEEDRRIFFTREKIDRKRFTDDDHSERNAGNIDGTFKPNSNLARFNSTAIEAPFVTKQRARDKSVTRSVKTIVPLSPSVTTNNERYEKEFSHLELSSYNITSLFSNGTNDASNVSELRDFVVKVH